MGWHAVGSHSYYYRNEKRGGRSVRLYVGARGSAAAELAADADAVRRLEREAGSRELRAELGRRREAERPLLELCEGTGTLAHAALLAAGFHRHAQGKWRRRREQTDTH